MKVRLVYPECPDTFWSFKHALKFIGRPASNPPLGLLTVAALLPRTFDARLLDLNVRALAPQDLRWADFVFVSAMAVQRRSAIQVIELCREARVPVVAGGPLFSSEPESFTDVDYRVLGEAELTLPQFLEDLRAGRPRRVYESRALVDLRDSPAPRWDLLNLDDYATMSVQYSRGCPHDCEFCNVTSLFGRRPRTKSGAQLVRELDALCDLGWSGPVFFVDDNLIGNRARVKRDLLPALERWHREHPRMELNTQVSIDLADDPALVSAMVRAGFDTVFIGIETPNERALAESDKRHNLRRDLLGDVRRLHRSGLQVQGGFILGFDSDGPAAFSEMVSFVQRSGIVTAMVGLLQALPGTRLYARIQREGRLLEEEAGDNVSGTTNILHPMGMAALHQGYDRVLAELYSPRLYYARVRTLLADYAGQTVPPGSRGVPRLRHIRALVWSFALLGVIGRERLEYWKLLSWALLHRRRSFGLAIRLAIVGHHFRRTCEQHVAKASSPEVRKESGAPLSRRCPSPRTAS